MTTVADEKLLRSIADDLPVAIWLGAVPSGEVVYVNRAFEEILGMGPPPDAARGNYVAPYSVETRDGRPYPEDQMPFERVLRQRTTVVIEDIVIHRQREKKKIYLRVFAKPLFDEQGNITHVLEAFHDINREVEAEQARAEGETRLRQAQRMEAVGNLAGGIAHDFNNMLATVRILTDHLERTDDDPKRLRLLADIGKVVDSASRLTHALLRFARRADAVVQPVSLSEIVSAAAALALRTVDRRIAIETETVGECWIDADAAQIEQVVMNLLVNARDAMPEGGRLRLACRPIGDQVELEVIDNGVGIDAGIRERIFEPYFTTKKSGPVKGTGLGLTTVYAIVKAHGGEVAVDDTPGGGTTMRVRFPASSGTAVADMRPLGPCESPRAGTVLLIEDEPSVRRAAVLALEGIGYSVHAAADGREAIALFREHHRNIDAVVLDMMLPGIDGRQTYVELRAIDPEVPVVLASGLGKNADAQATLELGARAFTSKPYDLATLSATIERLRNERSKTI